MENIEFVGMMIVCVVIGVALILALLLTRFSSLTPSESALVDKHFPRERKIGKWDAIIRYDDESKLYTVFYKGDGGAIITDAYLDKACRHFGVAMDVAEWVANSRITAKRRESGKLNVDEGEE